MLSWATPSATCSMALVSTGPGEVVPACGGGCGCDSGLQTSCTSDDVTHPLQNRVGDIICAYIIYIYTYIYKKYHLIQILYIVFVNVVVAFCIAHLLYYTYIYSIYPHIYCTAWYVSFICILCVIYIYHIHCAAI